MFRFWSRRWAGWGVFAHHVMVIPGEPALVAILDEAWSRESVELAGIDDQFRRN